METINASHAGYAHARYTFPSLDVRSDGRSKQRKTWLNNLKEVADKLHRPPELLLQWLQSAEGTTGGCDKSAGYPRWFLKGHHETAQLRLRTREFCASLVVCPRCGGCDTHLYTVVVGGSKKRPEHRIFMKCDSSGCETRLKREGLLNDKLLRHVPNQAPTPMNAMQATPVDVPEPLFADHDGDDETWWTEGHSDPFSPSAVAARQEKLLGHLPQHQPAAPELEPPGQTSSDLDPSIQAALCQFIPVFDGVSKQKEIIKLMEIQGYQSRLSESVTDLSPAQRFEFLTNLPDRIAKYSAFVLKAMYEQDIVDEDQILAWHQEADTTVLAVAKATCFVEWLASAESESE